MRRDIIIKNTFTGLNIVDIEMECKFRTKCIYILFMVSVNENIIYKIDSNTKFICIFIYLFESLFNYCNWYKHVSIHLYKYKFKPTTRIEFKIYYIFTFPFTIKIHPIQYYNDSRLFNSILQSITYIFFFLQSILCLHIFIYSFRFLIESYKSIRFPKNSGNISLYVP